MCDIIGIFSKSGVVETGNCLDVIREGQQVEGRQLRQAQLPAADQLRGTVGFGDGNKRGWNGAYTMSYDVRQGVTQYMAAQATYIGGGLIGYTRRIAKRRLCHAETIPMFVCPERPSALG